jgi:peptidoglycan-associated lipoprotein
LRNELRKEKIVNTRRRRHFASLVAVATLIFAAGCHKKVVPPPPPPPPSPTSPAPTATITVTPSTINPGGSAVLAWRTTDATEVSIDGLGTVNAYGTQNVTPTQSTTYHLVARGSGGSTDATANLTVTSAPPPPAGETMNEQIFEQNVKPAFFDYDSYEIRPDAQTVLAQDASFLAAHPTLKVVVGGYCDDRGSAEYNLALGENRANAAKQALVNGGVSPDRVRTVSYGKEKQFCTAANEACWQQNRRAGFSLDQ